MTTTSEQMRARSGRIDVGPMAALFYSLMRDGDVPPGRLEAVLDEVCNPETTRFQCSNGWLAQHAMDIATRLIHAESRAPLESEDARGEVIEKNAS